jgi:hypothetical protein
MYACLGSWVIALFNGNTDEIVRYLRKIDDMSKNIMESARKTEFCKVYKYDVHMDIYCSNNG